MALFGDTYFFSHWWGWFIVIPPFLLSFLFAITYENLRSRRRKADNDWIVHVSVFKVFKKLVFSTVAFYLMYCVIMFALTIATGRVDFCPYFQVFSTRTLDFYTLEGIVAFLGIFFAFTCMPCVFVGLWKPESQGSRMMIDFSLTLFFIHFVFLSVLNLNFPYQWQFWVSAIPAVIFLATTSEMLAYKFETMSYRAKGTGKSRKDVIEEKKKAIRDRRSVASSPISSPMISKTPSRQFSRTAPSASFVRKDGAESEGIGRAVAPAVKELEMEEVVEETPNEPVIEEVGVVAAADVEKSIHADTSPPVLEVPEVPDAHESSPKVPVIEVTPPAEKEEEKREVETPMSTSSATRSHFIDLSEVNMRKQRDRYKSFGDSSASSGLRKRNDRGADSAASPKEEEVPDDPPRDLRAVDSMVESFHPNDGIVEVNKPTDE